MRKWNRRMLSRVLACGLVLGLGLARAGAYPDHPITIVVPSAAGGASDLVARLIAEKIGPAMGTAVVILNKPGSGNVLGTNYVAHSMPDGYTFLMTYVDHVYNPYLHSHLPFDAAKDFTPLAYVGSVPQVLVVNNDLKANSVKELIALAKAEPGKLNFGSVGGGSSLHLAGEAFKTMAGIDIVHVPYNGGPASTLGLISNEVQILLPTISSVRKQIEAGQIRALGIGSPVRSPLLPNLPTIAEAGLPGYEASIWYGLLAPAATPKAIITRVNAEINKALAAPDVAAKLAEQGFTLKPGTPEELGAHIKADSNRWGKIIRDLHFQLD